MKLDGLSPMILFTFFFTFPFFLYFIFELHTRWIRIMGMCFGNVRCCLIHLRRSRPKKKKKSVEKANEKSENWKKKKREKREEREEREERETRETGGRRYDR